MRPQRGVATPYAKALFELARERGQLEAAGKELQGVAAAAGGDVAFRDFFTRPWVTAAAKRAVATEIGTRLGVSRLVVDFLALVAAQGRGDHLEAIAETYRDLVDRAQGRVRARVRTAVPLTDAERAMLGARLQRALGGSQVVLEEEVDRNLLGGFVAESGSMIVDGSLEGQLEQLRTRLARA